MKTKYKIKSFKLDKEYIKINWEDKKISKFHFLWLRDNCSTAIHPDSNMRKFNLLTISKNIKPKKIKHDQNKLVVYWNENDHISYYDLKWLRDHCYTELNSKEFRSPYFLWNNELKNNFEKITLDYNDIVNKREKLIHWISLLNEYGLVIIKNSPTKKKSAFKILNMISHHRETFFGTPFEVINIPKPNNQAYTADALTNHTDLPYYEYVPGYQFLHCLINDAVGGNSTVVDGFAVASHLRQYEKEIFNLLTTIQVKFKDNDFTQKAIRVLHSPIITLTKDQDFNDIRMNMGAMGVIDVHPNKMKKFYEAYRFFISLLHDEKFMIEFRLSSGDIFCFNNRRVLHGRKAFDPNSGRRHLQGYYVERDDLIARLNYFNNVEF